MSEVIKDKASVLTEKPVVKDLSISCVDEIGVKARMTFDSEDVQGLHIVYWMDDEADIEARVSSIFAMLFEEVIKTKELESGINQ